MILNDFEMTLNQIRIELKLWNALNEMPLSPLIVFAPFG